MPFTICNFANSAVFYKFCLGLCSFKTINCHLENTWWVVETLLVLRRPTPCPLHDCLLGCLECCAVLHDAPTPELAVCQHGSCDLCKHALPDWSTHFLGLHQPALPYCGKPSFKSSVNFYSHVMKIRGGGYNGKR